MLRGDPNPLAHLLLIGDVDLGEGRAKTGAHPGHRGDDAGVAATAAAIVGSKPSSRMTASFVAKWRKNVMWLTPAARTICSIVVASYPCSAKSRVAVSWRSARVRAALPVATTRC